jgi:excinuclease ABC subunit A
MRGYRAARFSFNLKGGRCEVCEGEGYRRIDLQFLPDVYLPCEACGGKRYNRETLEIRYRGLNIHESLSLTVEEALHPFGSHPTLRRKLEILQSLGLGYLPLNQPATTLSGGEAQRLKLAAELMRRDTGRTLYVLDEPTTGLHWVDVEQLLTALFALRDRGNTLVVIEHHLDVIAHSDWVIDLGPGAGEEGGRIVACGTPAAIAAHPNSVTGRYLAERIGSAG